MMRITLSENIPTTLKKSVERHFIEARACETAGDWLTFWASVCAHLTLWDAADRLRTRGNRRYEQSMHHHDQVLKLLTQKQPS